MQVATKKRVGILRGGTGKNYEPSIRKGGELISSITDNLGNKYEVSDILVDKDHIWHFKGIPVSPSDLASRVDLVWNLSHPSLSNVLDSLSIPHVSPPSFSHTLENNNDFLRRHVEKIGLQMPKSILLPLYQPDFDGPRERYAIKKAKEIHAKFPAPWMVKSFTPDSSMGIHLAKTFPGLVNAIEDGVNHEKSILVEEFIAGKVASVHSVPHFRNEEVYIFPLGNTFGNFSMDEKEKLSNFARDLHKHLGAKHYLKSDFVLNPYGRVYLLSIESTPDVKSESHLSQVCESVGTNVHQVLDHILEKVLLA